MFVVESRRLYIRNIPIDIKTKKDLERIFGRFGQISDCFFTAKDDAVVTYYDLFHAIEAQKQQDLDIVFYPKVDEKDDNVDEDTVRVSVKVHKSISESAVGAVFEKIGPIRKISTDTRNPNHVYVKFYDTRDAVKAVDKLHKTMVDGHEIYVAKAKTKVIKQQMPPPPPPQQQPQQQGQKREMPSIDFLVDQFVREVQNDAVAILLNASPSKRKKIITEIHEKSAEILNTINGC